MSGFEGKTVLVTGGASGIGRAVAGRFAAAGANVVVADLQEPPSDGSGDRVKWVRCDVGQAADVEAAVQAAVAMHGGLDVMVNNAGIDLLGPLTDATPDDATWVASINFLGVFYGIRYAAPALTSAAVGRSSRPHPLPGLAAAPVRGSTARRRPP